jgi:hypothetical protein
MDILFNPPFLRVTVTIRFWEKFLFRGKEQLA